MNRISVRFVLMLSTCALCSCATDRSVTKGVSKLQPGPKTPITRTITNFSDGLECMDNLLIEYKKAQVSFLIEDLTDNTGQINSGSRDMLIAALTSMSRRSGAIRVVAYGTDSGNALSMTQQAGVNNIVGNVPPYDIRGSISQYDSHVASNRNSMGFSLKKWGIGGNRRVSADILGIDLSVIRTRDLSVVNEATSSNQVVVLDNDSAADGDAVIKKAGVYYSFSVDRSDAKVQAVRNLFDLAAIELIGRVMKIPYWHCLDIPHDSESVSKEVSAWTQIFSKNNVLVSFLSRMLDVKGFYDNHEPNLSVAFQRSVRAYQQSLDLPQTGVVDLPFVLSMFRLSDASVSPVGNDRYLTTEVESDNEVYDATPESGSTRETEIAIERDRRQVLSEDGSEAVLSELYITVNEDSYLECFYQDASGKIMRLFPNRFSPDNRITVDSALELPGNMPFTIELETDEGELVSCFATRSKVEERLPLRLRKLDFEPLDVTSMAQVKAGIIKAALAPVSEATLDRASK